MLAAKGKKVDRLRYNVMYLCVALERMDITNKALADALKHGLVEADIKACLLTLLPKHWYKTMYSIKRPGILMDVYHRRFKGARWYIKFSFDTKGKGKKRGVWLVITSFKEKR